MPLIYQIRKFNLVISKNYLIEFLLVLNYLILETKNQWASNDPAFSTFCIFYLLINLTYIHLSRPF